jgi:hypothetical protein
MNTFYATKIAPMLNRSTINITPNNTTTVLNKRLRKLHTSLSLTHHHKHLLKFLIPFLKKSTNNPKRFRIRD